MILETALILLLGYSAIVTGFLYVAITSLKYVREDLPDMAFKVGSALIDEKAKEFLGEGGNPSAAGGRPQEGIVGFLSTPMGQNIVNMIMKKIQGGDKGGGSGIYR